MSDVDLERPLTVAYLGNFKPPYSTENDYRLAWKNNRHRVYAYQEGEPLLLQQVLEDLPYTKPDIFVWTRTPDLAARNGDELQRALTVSCRALGIPLIGVHLDRWWGLDREKDVETDPYFRGVDLLLTADGGHQEEWVNAGVSHRWLPPGVSEQWCQPGTPQDKYRSEIAFVGGWQGGYHKEAIHRHALVAWLQDQYGERVKFWPKLGEHAIRGHQLTDLYWSSDVVVGDSCLLPGDTNYCSDRIPETLGRGGVLLHPSTEGIDELFKCFLSWEMGDWAELHDLIDGTLDVAATHPDEYGDLRADHIAYTKQHNTYEKRVPQILSIMHEEGLLL